MNKSSEYGKFQDYGHQRFINKGIEEFAKGVISKIEELGFKNSEKAIGIIEIECEARGIDLVGVKKWLS